MTQFGYSVSFDDSEMQTLQRALGHYLGICQREIKKGVPIVHSGTIKRFRARLKKLKQTWSFTLHESEMIAVEQASELLGRMRTRDRERRDHALHCRQSHDQEDLCNAGIRN
jgi:hypothetical protein